MGLNVPQQQVRQEHNRQPRVRLVLRFLRERRGHRVRLLQEHLVRKERPARRKVSDRHFVRAKVRVDIKVAPAVLRNKDSVLDRKAHRVPVEHRALADLQEDSRSAPEEDRARRKLQWAVSAPVRVFQKPSPASRFMRANLRRAVAVRPSKSATLKASASSIPFALARAPVRARSLSRSLPFSANHANSP
jgi:hypothetical protein